MKLKRLTTTAVLMSALAASTLLATGSGRSSQEAAQQTAGAAAADSAPHSWTTEQIITSSVREAWALGGKTEEGFFQIVQALTQISAQKRGITLPDNMEAGKKAGDWIKRQAKKDPDQLLYVVVDRAVQYSARNKTTGQ